MRALCEALKAEDLNGFDEKMAAVGYSEGDEEMANFTMFEELFNRLEYSDAKPDYFAEIQLKDVSLN